MADEQDHAELAMCPFCGSERITVWNIRDGQQAVCKDCHAAGAPAFNGGADSATVRARAAWNRRAQRQAAPVSRDGEDFEQLMENAFNEGWRSREPLGQLINSRATMRKAWLESNARDALLSAIQTGTGVEEASDAEVEMLARYMAVAAYDVLHLTKRPTAGEWASENWRKFAYQAERYLNRTDGPTPTPEDGR